MKVVVDISDLHLDKNPMFLLIEPYLLDCALNYCACHTEMCYEIFQMEVIEYLFSGDYFDIDEDLTTIPIIDRINDLEEHEFNLLVMIGYNIYTRVTSLFRHIWSIEPLRESVLVSYIGHKNYKIIEVDIELDAPDHLIALVLNQRRIKKATPKLPITYIPQGI